MPSREDDLDQKLLLLGQQEIHLEALMKRIRIRARDAGQQALFAESDAAWDLFEELRDAYSKLQDDIAKVERELYTLRRNRI